MFRTSALCLLVTAAASPTIASAADALIANGATVRKLAGGFQFTEGPAADKTGNVYFTDIPNNRIHKWDVSKEKLSTFVDDSKGTNGLFFDRDGKLLGCQGKGRRIVSYSDTGQPTTITGRFNKKPYNSPNDLWIAPNGGIYFTDPRYGSQADLQQGGFHVYYLSPDRKTVTRALGDLKKPNGLIGTADGKTLYVADPGAGVTYRYNIQKDGTLSGKKLFCKSGSDGMTLDERGNVYLTRGGILVFNPTGKKIATIKFPEGPANVTFGGKDRKTLFVTARKGFYSLQMSVRGQ